MLDLADPALPFVRDAASAYLLRATPHTVSDWDDAWFYWASPQARNAILEYLASEVEEPEHFFDPV